MKRFDRIGRRAVNKISWGRLARAREHPIYREILREHTPHESPVGGTSERLGRPGLAPAAEESPPPSRHAVFLSAPGRLDQGWEPACIELCVTARGASSGHVAV